MNLFKKYIKNKIVDNPEHFVCLDYVTEERQNNDTSFVITYIYKNYDDDGSYDTTVDTVTVTLIELLKNL